MLRLTCNKFGPDRQIKYKISYKTVFKKSLQTKSYLDIRFEQCNGNENHMSISLFLETFLVLSKASLFYLLRVSRTRNLIRLRY